MPPNPTTNRNSIRNWMPPVNSSNAPPAFNNQPVPMDLSHSRAPNRWGQQRGTAQGRVAQTTPRTNNACFKCGQVGHYVQNCPMKQQRIAANLIDFDEESYDDETVVNQEETSTQGRINTLHQELMGMPQDEKRQVGKRDRPTRGFSLCLIRSALIRQNCNSNVYMLA